MSKLVSVVIPTYKRSDTLSSAIESVLNQKYKEIEIIVVDDNDPDTTYRSETEMVMRKYKGCQNIKYIKHERNKNGSAARNTGFRESTGDYIMFLDDDDEFLPEKVSSQVECLESKDQSWGACYTNYIRKKDGITVIKGSEKREGKLLVEELMRNLFIHAGSNLMVRRHVVSEVGGFNESFNRNQDIEFLVKILTKYKLAYVDMLGLIVNIHHKPGLFDFEEITIQYRNEFNSVIKSQPSKDQIKIERMLNLQLFRHCLTTSGKRIKALKMLIDKKIPLILIIKYLAHLLRRNIKKEAYGFRF